MATSFVTLPVIPQPFAEGGSRADIPNADTGTNRASWTQGWSSITSTPIAQGGVPPNRLDFNGVLNTLSKYAYALQEGKPWTYDTNVSNAIGGYPKGALMWRITSGVPFSLYASLVNNNTSSDFTDSSKWRPVLLRAYGGAIMYSYLADKKEAQVRNIKLVTSEPNSGVDGTIYMVIEE